METYKVIIIAVFASVISIFAYHQYLLRKGYIGPCVRRIYTVDLEGMLAQARMEMLEMMKEGRKVPPDYAERKAREIQARIEAAARRLPPGSVILPDSVVLGGERIRLVFPGERGSSEGTLKGHEAR